MNPTAISMTTPAPAAVVDRPYRTTKLLLGVLGRGWLWFIGGCLAITMVPVAFGWQSFVVMSASMAPHISTGDVVIVSPDPHLDDIDGRVISFVDPTAPDTVLTHRVFGVNDDGTLVTKGDANPTPDTTPIDSDDILGMGRLLVRFVGLPLVWVQQGSWLALVAVLASVVGAILAVVADHEEDDLRPVDAPAVAPAVPPTDDVGGRRRLVATGVGSALSCLVVLALAAGVVPASSAAFTAGTANTANTWAAALWGYTPVVQSLGPYLYWKLDETSGTTATDASGNGRTGTHAGGFNRNTFGALPSESPNRSVRLGTSSSCIHTTSTTAVAAPQVFTLVAWFRAESSYNNGGKLVGFERPRTGVATPTDGAYDRHLYMDGNGRIWFGVYNNAHVALSSPTTLKNNQWHMAVGTQGPEGMRLYIDGQQVAANANTTAEAQQGWWRAGCGNLAGWGAQWGGGNSPGTSSDTTANRTFQRDLDEVAVFHGTALTAAQVQELWNSR